MQSIQDIAKAIVAREGGYVNDPADPGGATKYGVTLATMRRLGLDLTGDGRIDVRDVRAMTPAKATKIFIDHYYKSPHIDALPAPIQASVFDMYVNAGDNAVKILQRLMRDMGQDVAIDGVIGAQTIAAAKLALALAPDHFANAYAIARRNYYYRLGDARPASRKYARRRDGSKGGWIVRSEAFMAPKYRLSSAEHRARVAAWG